MRVEIERRVMQAVGNLNNKSHIAMHRTSQRHGRVSPFAGQQSL